MIGCFGFVFAHAPRVCIKPAAHRTVTSLVACLLAVKLSLTDNKHSFSSSSSSMAFQRPSSAQSRRAWGSMDHGGSVNPAMDDDDMMPAAMESDIYAPKKTKSIAPAPQQPQETGCWASFTRGVRCMLTFLTLCRFICCALFSSF